MPGSSAKKTKREFSLEGGGWEIGRVFPGAGMDEIESWYPATVPGNIQNDLINADVIQDPYFGLQNEAARWVETHDWWYRRKVALPKTGWNRAILVFKGIDYESDVYFNGRRVASHEGMFSPVIHDVTKRVQEENEICVRIAAPSNFKDRIKTLKCQMSFGWDFAPSLLAMGIWDRAYILLTNDAYIKEFTIDASPLDGGRWEVMAGIDVDDTSEGEAVVEFEITGDNFDSGKPLLHKQLVVLHPGLNSVKSCITIENPKLWDVWEEGDQNLYRMNVTVRRGGRLLDSATSRFGLRSIKLLANSGSLDHYWTFEINGREKFIRGANWVPADSMPGRLTAERYRALLTKAREANINMLRVWGGGLREKQEFYDICDELGILVWQEFPFACPVGTYPVTAGFHRLVRQEASAIALSCRNHPSVAMFCGGNEFSATWNKALVQELEKSVSMYGGGRPFKPTSPTAGEHHRYVVHHMLGNISEFLEEECAFFSEFGLQSVPARKSVEKFIPRENLWSVRPVFPYSAAEFVTQRPEQIEFLARLFPDSRTSRNVRVWAYHNAQLLKITRYAREIGFDDLDSFISASQRMQAFALQVAVEHIRRRRMSSSGVMFWQFNEPWPAITWSVIDYYLEPKLAFHKLKEIYNPILASLQFPLKKYKSGEPFRAKVFLINDLHRAYKNLKVKIRVTSDGRQISSTTIDVPDLQPDSILELSPFTAALSGQKSRAVECTVSHDGKVLSTNSYDLTIHDSTPTSPLLKFGFNVMENIAWK